MFGSSKAHKELRHMLIEDHKLDAVISLPAGVFRPYAGVSTAILAFTKTGVGGTDVVWFYDVDADGWSLDDKRQPLLPDEKLGPRPAAAPSEEEHVKNNLPDIATRWAVRDTTERDRPRTAQSFCVEKSEIAGNGYDLSINRYKAIASTDADPVSPSELIRELIFLEADIGEGLRTLESLLR